MLMLSQKMLSLGSRTLCTRVRCKPRKIIVDNVKKQRMLYATSTGAGGTGTGAGANTDDSTSRISSWQSFREFFLHPLTWDRNNGYLNILLALAIFGFCFCTSCSSNRNKQRDALHESPKKV